MEEAEAEELFYRGETSPLHIPFLMLCTVHSMFKKLGETLQLSEQLLTWCWQMLPDTPAEIWSEMITDFKYN